MRDYTFKRLTKRQMSPAMPSDSERKSVKTIPLMTCTNKDCSCTGMDFCNVLPECANCGVCGMPLSIKKRSPKPKQQEPQAMTPNDRDQGQQDREAFEQYIEDAGIVNSTDHQWKAWQAAIAYERGKSADDDDQFQRDWRRGIMMDELLSVLDDAKIRFWSCRKCLDSGKRPCVDWINDTAICQICGNSNKLERAESALALLNQEERKP